MNQLNAQQLAFILDIKKEDARAKMCNAWEKYKGITKDRDSLGFEKVHGATRSVTKKIEDDYPQAMPIEVIASGLILPTLQEMVNDIVSNYLNRPASKKYILVDYPEKFIKKCENEGKEFPVKIDIPAALKSMLPDETKLKIYGYWKDFKTYDQKPRFKVPANG